MKKTNAVRILDQKKVRYELIPYEVDESDLSATHLAEQNQLPLEQLYKTLVAHGDKTGILIAVIPGAAELNLKSLASESGNKKVQMIPLKDLQPLTGYIRGGCTAIGMKKPYPVFLDDSALSHKEIYVSAGIRGLQILLNPKDYERVTEAQTGNLIH